MELTLRTLEGNAVIPNVLPSTSVRAFKEFIYDACKSGKISLDVPLPAKQRLVYMDQVLENGDLAGAGITSDDTLVLLTVPELPPVQNTESTPLPTAATIKAAITEEAKARGIESQLREEAPPRRRFDALDLMAGLGGGEMGGMGNNLLQLLEALEGRLNLQVQPAGGDGAAAGPAAAAAAGPAAAGAAAAAAGGAARRDGPAEIEALQQAAQELLSALVGPRGAGGGLGGLAALGPLAGMPLPPLHPQQLGQLAQGAAAAAQAEQQPQQEAPLQVPEPSADGIAQLVEMGFSEALARKALLLARNNVDAALEWVLQHMEDEDAEAPPTEQQLRQVYGPPPRPTAALLVNQLVDMGFDRAAADRAVRRFNNLDLAIAYLLQNPAASMAGGAGASQAAAAGAAPAAGAEAAAAGAGEAGSSAHQGSSQVAQAEVQPSGQADAEQNQGGAVPMDTHEGPEHTEQEQEEDAEGEYADEYEDAHDDYEMDEEEDEYEEEEEEEDEEFADAQYDLGLGRYGSMDLAQMGSTDMEQLLEGVGDIYTGHLAGLDAGLGPLQGMLLRMLEAPGAGAGAGAGVGQNAGAMQDGEAGAAGEGRGGGQEQQGEQAGGQAQGSAQQ